MRVTRSAVLLGGKLGLLGLSAALFAAFHGETAVAESNPAKPDSVALGYEIFNREWMANDPRGHGGDGLGPVFNDSSCVACHNSGGSGGAGPINKNIDILSASRAVLVDPAPTEGGGEVTGSGKSASAVRDAIAALAREMQQVHAGFKTGRTVVLHKFGTDPNYDAWRSRAMTSGVAQNPTMIGVAPVQPPEETVPVQGNVIQLVQKSPFVERGQSLPLAVGKAVVRNAIQRDVDEVPNSRIQEIRAMVRANNPQLSQRVQFNSFAVSRSQRNPTPLFGLGLIDAIPEQAIEAMAKWESKDSPETAGRVSRLKDGRVGRLGWKGQTANTEEFVLNACAVELGLEVPGHHQAISPQAPKYQPQGLDLNADECNALVAYVRSLPKPDERRASSTEEASHLEAGRTAFATVGCASCHVAKLGNVAGIFSDLLLHDMGDDMGDEGSYDGSDDSSDDGFDPGIAANTGDVKNRRARKSASRTEWRTPPLWGFRDSGPYLHDGRAQTLEQAVAMHGGQGQTSATKFFKLTPRERTQVESFLKSLVAPAAGLPRAQVAQADH